MNWELTQEYCIYILFLIDVWIYCELGTLGWPNITITRYIYNMGVGKRFWLFLAHKTICTADWQTPLHVGLCININYDHNSYWNWVCDPYYICVHLCTFGITIITNYWLLGEKGLVSWSVNGTLLFPWYVKLILLFSWSVILTFTFPRERHF